MLELLLKIIYDILAFIMFCERVTCMLIKLRNSKLFNVYLYLFFKYLIINLLKKGEKTMGVLRQGIFGSVSGKIGNLIGSSWKGIAVLKTMPASVANPKTAGQIAQRTKMTNVVAFAQLILATIIKPLWDRFSVQMSGFNDFVSTNLQLFGSDVPYPAENLVISKGKMDSTTITSAIAVQNTKDVTINWTDDSGSGYKLATDLAYIVAVNGTQSDVCAGGGLITRASGTATISFNDNMLLGDGLYLYLAFRRADGTIVSNTAYLQKNVTAS
jgi:hypothetical protein